MSFWFRVRLIGVSVWQTPLSLLYLIPLAVAGLLLVHLVRTPELLALMSWKACVVTIYWGLVALWMSIGPLSRWHLFHDVFFFLQMLGAGLLGLVLWAIFKPAQILTAGHILVLVSLLPCWRWTFSTCTAPGCARPFGLAQVLKEGEKYQSYSLTPDGQAVATTAELKRTLSVCQFCGEGTRARKWVREPGQLWKGFLQKAGTIEDPKARLLFFVVAGVLFALFLLVLWLITRLRAVGRPLMPAS